MLNSMLMCLALNVYFEARSDTMTGQYAVAQVVINRVQSSKFPDDVCSVVKQSRNDGTCQFSWYCDGKSDNIPTVDLDIYEFARTIAFKIYNGHLTDFTDGATHYHADYVKPAWAKSKTKTITVGNHIFYRWEK